MWFLGRIRYPWLKRALSRALAKNYIYINVMFPYVTGYPLRCSCYRHTRCDTADRPQKRFHMLSKYCPNNTIYTDFCHVSYNMIFKKISRVSDSRISTSFFINLCHVSCNRISTDVCHIRSNRIYTNICHVSFNRISINFCHVSYNRISRHTGFLLISVK